MKIGITGKVAITVMIIVFISSSILTLVSYQNSYQQVLQAAGVELLGCANITTGLINTEELEKAISGNKDSVDQVEKAINWTIEKKHIFETHYILSLEGKVVAGDDTFHAQGFTHGDMFFLDNEVIEMITTMKHGTYSKIYQFGGQDRLTGYAPIFKDHDPTKEVIAINAIDFDASIVAKRTWEMARNTVLLGIFLPFLATGLTFIFVRSLIKPVLSINEAVKRVATGDLSGELDLNNKKNDEIGELATNFATMRKSVKEIIVNASSNSEQVAATSQQLSANTIELEITSKDIQNSLQQISAGSTEQKEKIFIADIEVTKMSDHMNEINIEVDETAVSSSLASRSANLGGEKVQLVISQMNTIDQQTESIASNVVTLKKRSNEINEILTMITDVAAQTNLLALNAAIEAARAGEQGKGFSIVAQEVRKLAEQTGHATEKIRNIILQIQDEVDGTEVTIQKGSQEVKKGKLIVEEMSQFFSEIVVNTNESSTKMENVSKGISALTNQMTQLRSMFEEIAIVSENNMNSTTKMVFATKQQSEMMDEISAAATGLAKMAEGLQEVVDRFNVNG
ncbi:methyl-accepting chemotaxis protein [Anaerobacillus isosaccharinicus]|uniref:Methyl-accepting chemotaxis protein n=1 Tax=Anaerobacillus isosaccharinicus TaxID=1532552 RepID=A0A1S2LW79_9BACI|nr:methyl-accepting chemotaxis protein [Anaerobacillus isosaccharinicus]MBA5587934.1 methyl-accepting chemotaxis protein [Anaerobacillus isosaccharinicus]QOY33916.1 methyl-accepting chemotaxis protein [Anaerobacillus isosaccharinicus]